MMMNTHRENDFSVSDTAMTSRRLEVQKKLGEDTAGTADHSWPQEYPRPLMLSMQSWKEEERRNGIWSDGVFLPQSPLHMVEPGDVWALDFAWEVGKGFLVLFFLCSHFLLYVLNFF